MGWRLVLITCSFDTFVYCKGCCCPRCCKQTAVKTRLAEVLQCLGNSGHVVNLNRASIKSSESGGWERGWESVGDADRGYCVADEGLRNAPHSLKQLTPQGHTPRVLRPWRLYVRWRGTSCLSGCLLGGLFGSSGDMWVVPQVAGMTPELGCSCTDLVTGHCTLYFALRATALSKKGCRP